MPLTWSFELAVGRPESQREINKMLRDRIPDDDSMN
jgi:hypothetical protein